MSGFHDLPGLPGEWRVSTNKETHICAHKDVFGPKIITSPDQSPLSNGWTVSVIGSDRWENAPYFAKDADMEEVIETIQRVAVAIDEDTIDEIEPVDYIVPEPPEDDEENPEYYEVVNRNGVRVEDGFESESEAEAAATEYDEVSPGHSPHNIRRMDGEADEDKEDDGQAALDAFQ